MTDQKPTLTPCGNLPWPHAECIREHALPTPRPAPDSDPCPEPAKDAHDD